LNRFLNAPVACALAAIGQDGASFLVSAGAAAGITSVLLVLLMSQPRIFLAMAATACCRSVSARCIRGPARRTSGRSSPA
jgi:amino acid transporter